MAIPPPPPGFTIVNGGGAPQLSGRPIIRRGNPPRAPQAKIVKDNYIVDPNTGEATPIRGLPPQGAAPASELTKGQEALDKIFAQDYADYTAGGGFADIRKQLGQLREVSGRLKSGQNLTGPVIGALPDAMNAFVNPDAIAVRESVEEPVQRTLRLILGAQYTQKEGERLIARAYNPRLSEEENRKRVARLRIQIIQAAKAKEDAVKYFEKNGTLKGWSGRLYTASDFDPTRNSSTPPAKAKPQPKSRVINFDDLPE